MSEWSEYRSPFSWRYSGSNMRRVWSEVHKRQLMRRVWVALAAVQHDKDSEWIDGLRQLVMEVDVERALDLERSTHHDVMAELLAFQQKLDPETASLLHKGVTASDIVDNVDAMRLDESANLIKGKLCKLATAMADMIKRYAGTPCLGYTHLQPAEPTTAGYRLAQYGQDLLTDLEQMFFVRVTLRGKGIKGAVGSFGSIQELRANDETYPQPAATEYLVMARLHQAYWDVATQVYPRKQDYLIVSWLAAVAQSLSRFALDVRLMQSPLCGGIWIESRTRDSVGSTAMAHKQNPIAAEKICSLARGVASQIRTVWENAANSALERTLDDSANRRSALPEAFLAVDEMLDTARELIESSAIDGDLAEREVREHTPFCNLHRVQTELVARGYGQHIVRITLKRASQRMRYAKAYGNQSVASIRSFVTGDEDLQQMATVEELLDWVSQDTTQHLHLAMMRSLRIADRLRQAVSMYTEEPA
jgi:adenylosuccinate lyase